MQTKRNLRKKGKTLRKGGGNGVTKGLKLYNNHETFKATKQFYENNTNPLLNLSRPKNKKPSSAARKHVMETLAMLKKKTPPKN
jgi:hypothetical protein